MYCQQCTLLPILKHWLWCGPTYSWSLNPIILWDILTYTLTTICAAFGLFISLKAVQSCRIWLDMVGHFYGCKWLACDTCTAIYKSQPLELINGTFSIDIFTSSSRLNIYSKFEVATKTITCCCGCTARTSSWLKVNQIKCMWLGSPGKLCSYHLYSNVYSHKLRLKQSYCSNLVHSQETVFADMRSKKLPKLSRYQNLCVCTCSHTWTPSLYRQITDYECRHLAKQSYCSNFVAYRDSVSRWLWEPKLSHYQYIVRMYMLSCMWTLYRQTTKLWSMNVDRRNKATVQIW